MENVPRVFCFIKTYQAAKNLKRPQEKMNWTQAIKSYKTYLQLEKSAAENTIDSYLRDVTYLHQFATGLSSSPSPLTITYEEIQEFLAWITDMGLGAKTQARIISGLRSFFNFLILENSITTNPVELIETPKIGRKLPDTLSYEEIVKMLEALDLSKPESTRNKAIIETLYSCGLRVSELVNLQLSGYYPDEGFVRVIGKGDKERMVPIGDSAIRYIDIYLDTIRRHQQIKSGHGDILFLNRRGAKLTRVMIFTIIKNLCRDAGIQKRVSPHTFRHSFASHLVDAGADLRAVQEMLGHVSITTTEIYTHLSREYLRAEVMNYHPSYAKKYHQK